MEVESESDRLFAKQITQKSQSITTFTYLHHSHTGVGAGGRKRKKTTLSCEATKNSLSRNHVEFYSSSRAAATTKEREKKFFEGRNRK